SRMSMGPLNSMNMEKDNETILGIYNYLNTAGPDAAYYLIYLYDKGGLVDRDLLRRIYEEMFFTQNKKFDPRFIGPFDNLESLHQFTLRLCVKSDASRVRLLSAMEYNSIIEGISSLNELNHALNEKGVCLENVEKMNRRKGIWGKIFS
ncbi:MAG: hypothetical protein WCG27_02005, partial [Pseudomonadota bacterium]